MSLLQASYSSGSSLISSVCRKNCNMSLKVGLKTILLFYFYLTGDLYSQKISNPHKRHSVALSVRVLDVRSAFSRKSTLEFPAVISQLLRLKKGFKSNYRASKLFPLLLLKGHHHNCPRQLKSFHVKAKGHINSHPSSRWSGGCEWSSCFWWCPASEFFHTKARVLPLPIWTYLR